LYNNTANLANIIYKTTEFTLKLPQLSIIQI